ncbi:MAG TPA: N-acetylmuramoyl-L-alanine amidase, partial [bacterium]|nr:N-acetylmuramoyl-L-alanine amidase [bacterium]
IPKGGNKTCSLQLEGFLPEETTVTLSCNNPGKVSLWDGETENSFPYNCSASSLPKNLILKGEAASSNTRDITLTLTTSEGGSDTAKVTVFKIDLDWDGLSDETKYETGLYIPLNVDDDNSDTMLDKDQSPVFGENDLKKLIIRKPSPSDLPNSVSFIISSGSSKMKLWENTATDTEKIAEVATRNYSISDDLQSDTWLWAEGYAISTTKEVEVKISYEAPDGTIGEDKVKATVTIGTVLLDPGHGGTDSGAIGPTYLYEKVPNLDIALRLRTLLQDAGLTVDMTRDTDIYISKEDRADMAKNAQPKYVFFFSLHENGVSDTSIRGTETFTTSISPYTLETTAANEIQGRVHGVVLENNRGVKTASYVVLRHSLNGNTDGNLSETTFISNPISEDRLKQNDFKQSVAEAMKKAILKVFVEDIIYPKQPN